MQILPSDLCFYRVQHSGVSVSA